jgi:protocatechuate 3,4-dioxygenase beta subunit
MSLAGLMGLAGCGEGGIAATTVANSSSSGSSSSSSSSSSTGTSTSTSSSETTTCSQGISTTEGPYSGGWYNGISTARRHTRGHDHRHSSNGYQGVPLTLSFAVYTYAANGCSPLQNARVDIWHCDAQGIYSEEVSQNETTLDYSKDNFQRGYQLTDASGLVSFTTIFPGWYTGRTTHIHIRIRTYDISGDVAINSTAEVFFEDALASDVYSNSNYYTRTKTRSTYNSSDSIYNAQLLMSVSGSISAGYTNTLYGIGLPFGS